VLFPNWTIIMDRLDKGVYYDSYISSIQLVSRVLWYDVQVSNPEVHSVTFSVNTRIGSLLSGAISHGR
jgi:hypothetical protein